MQATARFPDGVPHPILQQADRVFHDSIAFDAPHGLFNAHADGREATVRLLFRRGEFPSTRFLLRLEHGYLRQQEALEAFSLIQATSRWQPVPCLLRSADSRRFAFPGGTQEANLTPCIDHQDVCERVTLLLATVIFFLLLWILWTLDGALSPIMPNRGELDVASVLCRVSSAANSSAVRAGSRSCSPQAWFKTVCNR